MAASIPLPSTSTACIGRRSSRDAKNTARASRLLARETNDDGAHFWTSSGIQIGGCIVSGGGEEACALGRGELVDAAADAA